MSPKSCSQGWVRFEFHLEGISELYMDAVPREILEQIRKKIYRPGEHNLNLSPKDKAAQKIHHGSNNEIGLPRKHIIGCLCRAAKNVKLPGTRHNINSPTYGNMLTQFIRIDQPFFRLFTPKIGVKKEGWKVQIFKGIILALGEKKSIRLIRPRFNNWTIKGIIRVNLDVILEETIKKLFQTAGTVSGLGPMRPGLGGTGHAGMFKLTKWKKVEELASKKVAA